MPQKPHMARCLALVAVMVASISCKLQNPPMSGFSQSGEGGQREGPRDTGNHVSFCGVAKPAHVPCTMRLRGGLGDRKCLGQVDKEREEEAEEAEEDWVGPWWTTSEGVKLPDDAEGLYDTGIALSRATPPPEQWLPQARFCLPSTRCTLAGQPATCFFTQVLVLIFARGTKIEKSLTSNITRQPQ